MTLFNCKPAKRIASGFHPDPSICEKPDGGYVMVNSSFEFMPGLPVFESEDGEHWTKVGHALSRPSQFPYESMGNSQGIYAPTIRYHDGLYYLIVTNVNVGNMLLTASDPSGEWSDPIWIPDWPGIDPSLFFDDDGTVYICGNESGCVDEDGNHEEAGIYLSRLDVTTGEVLDKRKRICGGITGSNPEGPHMLKRGDMYYLMWAEGGTESGHMENIARSNKADGPYEMYSGNPLITNRSTHLTLQAIGHCDCAHFEDERTLMVFHGTRNNDEYPAQGWIGREPYAVWFTWKDGWPQLADQSYDCTLNGNGDALEHDVEWITPGRDDYGRYSVSPNQGVADSDESVFDIEVSASGNDFDLPNDGAPLIGTRQTDMDCLFEAAVVPGVSCETAVAGIAAYGNDKHVITVSIERGAAKDSESAENAPNKQGGKDSTSAEQYTVSAQVNNAGLRSTVGSIAMDGSQPVTLRLLGTNAGYVCSVQTADGLVHELGPVPGKVLSFTNAGGFTGTLLGVFAHGTGQVKFSQVRYQPLMASR
ncbi:glycoside hydrolase family 43 protein [Bifidobacterium tsurumiense]|uniref:Xylosidase n=1 Tax=Bifidobacterium tsurumiense TaxID=356829 RepID=A0A087EAU8_9BIFI|nr:glycoside hydrolase family 43 protein [Bifidobacterium tsurumiense]KFJ04899.1 xylosidase [Bifidobacterium tsurumiense]MDY4678636.1 family 43 glycosylhydrolase [Bifidobacterium tsurumiense]MSS13404.1 glycoside hydrolase family 43 protein [Bifidobacterium tsurumiense]